MVFTSVALSVADKSAKPPQEQLPTPQVGNNGEPGMLAQLPESPLTN